MSLEAAQASGQLITSQTSSIDSSGGSSFRTVGIVRDLPITIARGTPHEVTVLMDVGVVSGVNRLYGLLLGTPFLKRVGAFADPVYHSFFYRPSWAVNPSAAAAREVHNIPLK
jgi:hypothetical protein